MTETDREPTAPPPDSPAAGARVAVTARSAAAVALAHDRRGRVVGARRVARRRGDRRLPHPPSVRRDLTGRGDTARLECRDDQRRADVPEPEQRPVPHRARVERRPDGLARRDRVAELRRRRREAQQRRRLRVAGRQRHVQHAAHAAVAERRQRRGAHAPRLHRDRRRAARDRRAGLRGRARVRQPRGGRPGARGGRHRGGDVHRARRARACPQAG